MLTQRSSYVVDITMKYFILLFILCLNGNAQTSIQNELAAGKGFVDHYSLKNGQARKMVVKVITNPDDDDKIIGKWIYKFPSTNVITGKLYRNGALISTVELELDANKRTVFKNLNFKDENVGWERTISNIEYGEKSKEFQILNKEGEIESIMHVEFDSLKSPTKITTLDMHGKFKALATADYDYRNGTFNYKVFKKDMSIEMDRVEYYNLNYILKRNEFGDITEMFWPIAFAKKDVTIKHKIEYDYDKKGNWTKITRILVTPETEKVLSIIKRKINYQ